MKSTKLVLGVRKEIMNLTNNSSTDLEARNRKTKNYSSENRRRQDVKEILQDCYCNNFQTFDNFLNYKLIKGNNLMKNTSL